MHLSTGTMKKNRRFNNLNTCLGFNEKVFCETNTNVIHFQKLLSNQLVFSRKPPDIKSVYSS